LYKIVMKHIILFSLLALLSCSSKDEDRLAFKEYTDHIPKVSLPANYWCGLPGRNQWTKELPEAYARFVPGTAEAVFGKIESGESDFTFILYGGIGDIIYPSLYSYSDDGEIIDSIRLGGGCSGDDKVILSTHSTIDEDMNITVLDSARWISFAADEQGYVVDSVTVDRKIFKVSKKGHFEEQGG
jgi:hypothetical protein